MEQAVALLKDHGLKSTPQRIAIYNYLCGTTAHPTVETIFSSLHPSHPTMSLATVYKTLKTLVEIGLVQELNVGEGNFRYDGNCSEHGHIQCIQCGKVDDLCGIDFSPLNKMVEENTHYNVKWNKLFFYGLCKDCQ